MTPGCPCDGACGGASRLHGLTLDETARVSLRHRGGSGGDGTAWDAGMIGAGRSDGLDRSPIHRRGRLNRSHRGTPEPKGLASPACRSGSGSLPSAAAQGSSSNGRANDSKSLGWGFESLLPCHPSRGRARRGGRCSHTGRGVTVVLVRPRAAETSDVFRPSLRATTFSCVDGVLHRAVDVSHARILAATRLAA